MRPATFISRRWRWPTVAVVLGMLFLARLGVWQLDRLEWRRGLNAARATELARAPLDLNSDLSGVDLAAQVDRQATAAGVYDFERQFLVESQIYNGRPGRYLLTPLRLEGANGEAAVLVNRGWLPEAETAVSAYHAPAGPTTEAGVLRPGETLTGGRETAVSEDRRLYRVDVAAAAATLPYPVLPVYLQLAPEGQPDPALPYQVEPDLILDEGNHLSYAIQWFSFAVLLAVIYVLYVRRQEGKSNPEENPSGPAA